MPEELIQLVDFDDRHRTLKRILGRFGSFDPEVEKRVREILQDVEARGDEAVLEYTERFDGVRPTSLRISADALAGAAERVDAELMDVIKDAAAAIRRFHEHQREKSWFVEDGDGVMLGQRVVPMERVGLYVPGGTAAYPSSVLMNVIPAQIAGVEHIAIASPPQSDGLPPAAVLAAAHFLGIDEVYATGGAQAIGALAYGTDTIPAVDKVVGPGNAYVAMAKRQVFGRVDIDSIAGPSEIVILADASAHAEFVAADLLSQAEHDERASAVLVTTDRRLGQDVAAELERQLSALPRSDIARTSLNDFGAIVVASSLEDAVSCVNELAPEHLELMVEAPWEVLPSIRHAGAIFLGPYSSEPVGDYFAGPNHVLPTGGTARYASALSVGDFLRHQSIIAYTAKRLVQTGPRVATFARGEGLEAHAAAVEARLRRLNKTD